MHVDMSAGRISTSEKVHSCLDAANKSFNYTLRFFVSITDIDDCLLRVYKSAIATAGVALHVVITVLFARKAARRNCWRQKYFSYNFVK
jgi:hypothetical protein